MTLTLHQSGHDPPHALALLPRVWGQQAGTQGLQEHSHQQLCCALTYSQVSPWCSHLSHGELLVPEDSGMFLQYGPISIINIQL